MTQPLLKEFVMCLGNLDWYLKQLEEYFNSKLPLMLLSVKIIQRNQLRLKYQNKLIVELLDCPTKSM